MAGSGLIGLAEFFGSRVSRFLQVFHSSHPSGHFRNSHGVLLQVPMQRRALARAGADVLLPSEQASLELPVDLDKN